MLIIFFKKFHMRDSAKLIIILSISFLLIECEEVLKPYIPMSGLISIMVLAITIYRSYEVLAKRLSEKYNRLWVAAEVLLFVLVGATVDLKYVFQSGIFAALLIVGGLIFRMIGVLVCLIKTKLTRKEKAFCMIAYTPKATVQAAIGGVPLSMGLACGNKVLTVAVLAILITAPFGAILIDSLYKKLCEKEI